MIMFMLYALILKYILVIVFYYFILKNNYFFIIKYFKIIIKGHVPTKLSTSPHSKETHWK